MGWIIPTASTKSTASKNFNNSFDQQSSASTQGSAAANQAYGSIT
jgi:hypothetical protein